MHGPDGLYPPIEPYRVHRLAVDEPHELHVEECGAPDGLPVVFLHGGPGAGAKPAQRRTFDPARFRAVLFDQRGCGRSTPSAELAGNDTAALVADIERVREHLVIERWLVAGGSWGSLLALAYATAHPDRCLGLRLHGVFLGSAREVRWWFHGIGRFFPEAFADFAGHVPEGERGDLLAAYHARLTDPDPAVQMATAQALRGFSARTQTLVPSPAHIAALTEPRAALEIARLFTHYCAHGFFMPEDGPLAGVEALRHLPCEIVQGRYDVVTPPEGALRLHAAWPEARLTMVDLANHVATPEAPALSAALSEATDRLADRLEGAEPAPSIDDYLAPRTHHSPAVSEDGGWLAWISDESGLDQLWTRELPEGEPRLRTSIDEKVGTVAFRPGTRDVLFTTDRGGDERHQLWLLEDGAPAPRALTDAPAVVHAWGAFDRAGARAAFASNARNAFDMDVEVMDLATGERRVVLEGTGWRTALSFTPDGRALLVQENQAGMFDAALVLLDLATGERRTLLEAGRGAHVAAARWIQDGARLLLATDAEGEWHGLASLDIGTGALDWLARPEGDVELLAVAKGGGRAAYAVNRDGWTEILLRDLATGEERAVDGLPKGRATSLLFTPDGGSLIIAQGGFARPSVIVRVGIEGGAVETLCAAPFPPDDGFVVEPSLVSVPSFDGADVSAFVFEPHAPAPPGGRPALVIVHGGPESQYAAHWRADVQWLVRRGWTVVAPNVRGSTGYGRAWRNADDRERRMDAVADLHAVRDWLAARPEVDASRLVVYGQSYGGFMVLAAITEHPGDWCAAAEFYGIADFRTLLDTTGPWRRALRAVEYGDPDTEEGRALLARISPMRRIDRVRVPLFVAHGLEDPRVPPGESETVVSALRGRGRPVEFVRIEREGHGFARAASRRRVYAALTRFLRRAVG